MLDKSARYRYTIQWVTSFEGGVLQVKGYCVRDTDSSNWETVFHHEDENVCRKVCEMLNEGDNKC